MNLCNPSFAGCHTWLMDWKEQYACTVVGHFEETKLKRGNDRIIKFACLEIKLFSPPTVNKSNQINCDSTLLLPITVKIKAL